MHQKREKIETQKKLKIQANNNKSLPIRREHKPFIIRNKRTLINKVERPASFNPPPSKSEYKNLKEWVNIIPNTPVFIMGNSPTLSEQDLSVLDTYFTIGINRTFLIYQPTVLFWQDRQLLRDHKEQIHNCDSIKVCRDENDPNRRYLNFSLSNTNFKFENRVDVLYGRGNSGALVAEMAVSMGASSIILLGMDCAYKDGKNDFWGKNKDHSKYFLTMCNRGLQFIKKDCPIPIYSCSENSVFPSRKLSEVIEELSPIKYDKEYYKNLFRKKEITDASS
jgi:hypothetical protein